MVYTIPFVCHGAKWGFESFETSKALPLPYTSSWVKAGGKDTVLSTLNLKSAPMEIVLWSYYTVDRTLTIEALCTFVYGP